MLLFSSLVRPQWEFSTIIWDCNTICISNKIETVQKHFFAVSVVLKVTHLGFFFLMVVQLQTFLVLDLYQTEKMILFT